MEKKQVKLNYCDNCISLISNKSIWDNSYVNWCKDNKRMLSSKNKTGIIKPGWCEKGRQ